MIISNCIRMYVCMYVCVCLYERMYVSIYLYLTRCTCISIITCKLAPIETQDQQKDFTWTRLFRKCK